jgi:hypothetical protein
MSRDRGQALVLTTAAGFDVKSKPVAGRVYQLCNGVRSIPSATCGATTSSWRVCLRDPADRALRADVGEYGFMRGDRDKASVLAGLQIPSRQAAREKLQSWFFMPSTTKSSPGSEAASARI